MAQEKVRILWNREVAPSYMHIGLECKTACVYAGPGQFVMLKVDNRNEPLLRRPFSINQVIKEDGRIVGVEILYKIVGTNTTTLSNMKENEYIDLVGPLGQGFRLPEKAQKVFITAGGIGVAPVVYLASWLLEKGISAKECEVFIGGRTSSDVLCPEIFRDLGMQVHTATDDGSLGHHGLVTDLIERRISENAPDVVYSCGPHPMLKAVADISEKKDVECQVSVETLMACGICACLGCAIEYRDDVSETYMHVCKNGPVFRSHELKL